MVKYEDSIEYRFPSIAKEWHPTKNKNLSPRDVTCGSNRKIWWIGICGHEWQEAVCHRTRGRTGCPYCSGHRVLSGFNDLATKNPRLASEWNYGKNGSLSPRMVAKSSNKKVWWKCSKCGYEWESTINNRDRGNGCPCCSNRVVVPGINDILTVDPTLAQEWDYEQNEGLLPKQVTPGSGKKVWWKCSKCGHKWKTTVASRYQGTGCPNCAKDIQLGGFHDSLLKERGSLADNYPFLIQEWNYEKNGSLRPEELLAGTARKVWWKCSTCGYEWRASIASRTSGVGCPLCSNKTVVCGINDLATLRPDLLEEWLYSRNTISPSEVSIGSGKEVWWKCRVCGNEWKTRVADRTGKKNGCPNCWKRSQTSFPEQAIYFYLKQYYPDTLNRYTELFGDSGFELDIYIPSIRFAIEYDGLKWHASEVAMKREKTKYVFCQQNGIVLCRIKEYSDNTVANNDMVADYIIACAAHPNNQELARVISEITSHLSIEIDVDIERDTLAILEQYYSQLKEGSLASRFPELAKEWNYDRNGDLTPEMVFAVSGKPVWWKCALGHEWKVSPGNRVSFKSNCPYCSNKKVLQGFNDLATLYPETIKAWDYENNQGISPYQIGPGNSKTKVWWICKKGHHFSTSVYQYLQMSESKCPICSGKQVLEGYNDLAHLYPELAQEWDYDKNRELTPNMVVSRSNKKVWWKGKCNHEWQATVANRVFYRTGCPFCGNRKLLTGFNDLQTKSPSLAEEWDTERNNESPSETLFGGEKKHWWKCKTCSYVWHASISERIRGRGCPACAHQAVKQGVNDFESRFPEAAKWWDYSKNGDLLPSMVLPFSEKKVWWKCDNGHSFLRAVKYASRG